MLFPVAGSQYRAGRESRRISLGAGLYPVSDSAPLVRDRRLGVRRVGRVLLDAADKIERGVERLVVLRIRRDIGLRAGLLVALGLEVAAQRGLAARVGARLELLGYLLQHLDVGRNALRLDGASGRGEVARGCQPQRPIARAKRNDGLHRALAERARADDRRAPVILERTRHDFRGRLDKNNKPRVLGWPQPLFNNPEDRPYFLMVEDLCKDMAEKLDELKRQKELEKTATPKWEERQQLHVTTTARPEVLLAETTDDLIRKRDEARRYLEQAGIAVLPAGSYYGLARPDYDKAVLGDLANCAAFVQLLGPELGRCLTDVPDGFGWLQYELAKRQHRPILQWRSPDLKDLADVEDERQKRLLETADAMPFEDFKQKIVRALRKGDNKPPARPSFIFINCDAVDTEKADDIGRHLGGAVDWERPPYEEMPRARQLQDKIETNLIDCDGLFI